MNTDSEYCYKHEDCYHQRKQGAGGGEHYKGGTDFCNRRTLLPKDLSRVYLELGGEIHDAKTFLDH